MWVLVCQYAYILRSLPAWERGLKPRNLQLTAMKILSLPAWVGVNLGRGAPRPYEVDVFPPRAGG